VQNSGDNVFENLSAGTEEAALVSDYLGAHDLAPNSRRAIVEDLRKFVVWFSGANSEPFRLARVLVLPRSGGIAVRLEKVALSRPAVHAG
jgi:hypothetical protein